MNVRLVTRLFRFFRKVFGRQRAERELDEEVHSYAAQITEEKIAAGLSPGEALRQVSLPTSLAGVTAGSCGRCRRQASAGQPAIRLWPDRFTHLDLRLSVLAVGRHRGQLRAGTPPNVDPMVILRHE